MRTKKKTMRTEDQEALDLNAVHNIDEEKITTTMDSDAVVSAMSNNMLPKVPKSQGQVLPGQRIKVTGPRRQEHAQVEERVHATCGRGQSTGIGEQNLQEEQRRV